MNDAHLQAHHLEEWAERRRDPRLRPLMAHVASTCLVCRRELEKAKLRPTLERAEHVGEEELIVHLTVDTDFLTYYLLYHLGALCNGCCPRLRQLPALAAAGLLPEDQFLSEMHLDLALSRYEASGLRHRLAQIDPKEARETVEEDATFHSWGLAELLCKESLEAAPRGADEALWAADLALAIAERITFPSLPADCVWDLQMLAHAHRANALRVAQESFAAQEALLQAERCWALAETRYLPYRGTVLSLQASLEMFLGHYGEAVETAGEALGELEGPDEEVQRDKAKLFCQRAQARAELGHLVLALEDANAAAELVDPAQQPALALAALQQALYYLQELGHFRQALELLPRVEAVAEHHGRPGEKLRVLWAKARLFAGLGRRHESQVLLRRVQEEFWELAQPLSAAAVTLEMATLYFQEGNLEAVRELAREIYPVFRDQHIHREALAALALFQQAVHTEQVTGTLLSELVTYFRKAQTNPSLRFTLNPGEG